MSKRKVKVEMSDEQDNKITITFEGKLDEKNLKNLIVSANNLLGKGVSSLEDSPDMEIQDALELPLYDRVKMLISTAYGLGSLFTSNDLCDSYQDIFGAQLKITTASTYLARLYEEGFLERSGSRNERKYQLKRELREKIPKLITQ
ncbi:MAG: hypothetical protein FK734_14745 [Asgard group archaeon]|nr:hypothetical protein [Asgard group archaeon]